MNHGAAVKVYTRWMAVPAPEAIKAQLAALQNAADSSNPKTAATRTTFLRNSLMRVPEFRESLAVLKAPAGEEACANEGVWRAAQRCWVATESFPVADTAGVAGPSTGADRPLRCSLGGTLS